MKINAAFNKYLGQKISILSVILPQSEKRPQSVLVIAREENLHLSHDDETALIVDNPLQESYDMIFKENNFMESINAWRYLLSVGRVILQNDLAKYNPNNVIDITGTKENGKEDINIDMLQNGNVAILATCLFFYRQIQQEKTSSMFDNLVDFYGDGETSKETSINHFFMTI